jgi:hypothetical protein
MKEKMENLHDFLVKLQRLELRPATGEDTDPG